MGSSSSKDSKGILPASFPADERVSGLANFGNTCYVNAVLQVLYACRPFRHEVIDWCEDNSQLNSGNDQNATKLLHSLGMLWKKISGSKKQICTTNPKHFITALQQSNDMFTPDEQHDAHECFLHILNTASESIKQQKKTDTGSSAAGTSEAHSLPSLSTDGPKTFVEKLFGGELVSCTKCLICEKESTRTEPVLDLSLDIEPMCSLSSCLRSFSAKETLNGDNKFKCEHCGAHTEAHKSVSFKSMPEILVMHLKRFNHSDAFSGGRASSKLSHRVTFPQSLRLRHTVDHSSQGNPLYHLRGVVVHLGAGLHRGHFISFFRLHSTWFLADDEDISIMQSKDVARFFGWPPGTTNTPDCAYLLLYEREDCQGSELSCSSPALNPNSDSPSDLSGDAVHS